MYYSFNYYIELLCQALCKVLETQHNATRKLCLCGPYILVVEKENYFIISKKYLVLLTIQVIICFNIFI